MKEKTKECKFIDCIKTVKVGDKIIFQEKTNKASHRIEPYEVKIIKIGTKFITVQQEGSSFTKEIEIETGNEKAWPHGSVYSSMEGYTKHRELCLKRELLRKKITNIWTFGDKFNEEELNTIISIIDNASTRK